MSTGRVKKVRGSSFPRSWTLHRSERLRFGWARKLAQLRQKVPFRPSSERSTVPNPGKAGFFLIFCFFVLVPLKFVMLFGEWNYSESSQPCQHSAHADIKVLPDCWARAAATPALFP